MAKILGSVPITGFVAPTDDQDVYPSHSEEWGRGGYRTVDTILDRNNIPTQRKKEGMLVNVTEDNTVYKLINGNWEVFSCGVNYDKLESIEEPLLNDDELMIFRGGKPFKVKLEVLSGFIGNELPLTAYTDTNGQGITDLSGNYYTSL